MEFHVLGQLAVCREGQQIPISGTKLRALLAYLLIHVGKPVTANALIEELWGDQPPSTVHNTLQTNIRQLRQLLEPERRARQEPRVLRTVANGYLLDVERDRIDSARFEQSLSEGRAALQVGDAHRAGTVLREGLALWRGQAFVELGDFAVASREAHRLGQLRLVGIELRIAADLALGWHAEVLDELDHLVRQHPLREDLIEHFMLALYRCGRQSEALATYRAVHERLAEEVGTSPRPALQDLQQRILRHDPVLDLPDDVAVEAPADDLSPRKRYRVWILVAVLMAVTLTIGAWALGLIRPGGGRADVDTTAPTPVIFNDYEVAIKPGIGYDLDIPPGQPADWHSSNNSRSPDYEFLDLYRTSPLADKDKLSGIDLRRTNEFNVIHLVDAADSPDVCRRLPEHGGGNVVLADVKVGSRICIRTRESRWAMLTITRMPSDRAAVLFIRVTVLNNS